MALYIVVKTGPAQGESYELTDGLIIGRRGASVKLNDPKVSSEHAKIKQTPEGLFELHDLGSKNGVFQHGDRVERILLSPGDEFEIGSTTFSILAMDPKAQKEQNSPEKSKKRWNELLASFLRKSIFDVENSPQELLPMRPALVLDFLRGPQAETRWVLGYGPRKVGKLSVDLPIFEADASDLCFEVFPSSDGIHFKPLGKEVKLNGQKISSEEILKVGDRIQILGTELEVDFIE